MTRIRQIDMDLSAKISLICVICVLLSFKNIFSQNLQFNSESENLGKNVNSAVSEIHPVISPDGRTLYFVRKNHSNNPDKDGIWFSVLQNDNTWSAAKDMGSPLNISGYHTGIQSIAPDGNTILLMNIYRYFDGSVSGGGSSMSFRSRGGWTFPKQQNIDKFENKSEYVGFYLCNDGKTMLMSVEAKKGLGKRDLYVSFKTKENEWSKPKNLDAVINTPEDEDSPFLAADGVTLYFSSEGLGGYGSSDIWFSKRLDDTWTNWSKPVNMGNKINSPEWDSYFTLPASGEYAYFVSSKNSYGRTDIFRIRLPAAAKPNPVALVKGKVLDAKTKEPVMAEIRYEILPGGEEAGIARSEPVNGEYKIVLPFGKNYGFMARADRFYAVNENLDLSGLKEYTEVERNLLLAPIEVGEVVRLNNIFFEFGKAALKEESFLELNRVVKLLTDNPKMEIELSGHTDNVGSDEANQKLSEERAQAVVDYLNQNGIGKSRLAAHGYGESKPVAANDTEEGKQLNRRVEFTIVKK